MTAETYVVDHSGAEEQREKTTKQIERFLKDRPYFILSKKTPVNLVVLLEQGPAIERVQFEAVTFEEGLVCAPLVNHPTPDGALLESQILLDPLYPTRQKEINDAMRKRHKLLLEGQRRKADGILEDARYAQAQIDRASHLPIQQLIWRNQQVLSGAEKPIPLAAIRSLSLKVPLSHPVRIFHRL